MQCKAYSEAVEGIARGFDAVQRELSPSYDKLPQNHISHTLTDHCRHFTNDSTLSL